jgi:hypothetical protein
VWDKRLLVPLFVFGFAGIYFALYSFRVNEKDRILVYLFRKWCTNYVPCKKMRMNLKKYSEPLKMLNLITAVIIHTNLLASVFGEIWNALE